MRSKIIILGAASMAVELIDRTTPIDIKETIRIEPERMPDIPPKFFDPPELSSKSKRDWEQRKYKKGKRKP